MNLRKFALLVSVFTCLLSGDESFLKSAKARSVLAGLVHDKAAPQNPDTSANADLNGTYFVRQVLLSDFDRSTGRSMRARSVNGLLLFDGKGGFAFTGRLLDSKTGTKSAPYTTSGSYGVSANGTFSMQSLIDSNDTEFGGVGATGPSAIVASATEGGYQDLLVGIPVNPAVSASTLSGPYRAVYIDYLQGDVMKVRDASFTLNPNGSGNMGSVAVSGYAADQGNTLLSQTVASVPYSVSSPAGPFTSLNFGPASPSQLISGSKMTSVSPDGNLILALDPDGFDLMFAVRAYTGSNATASYSGMYYYATLSVDNSDPKSSSITSNYGSINATGTGVALVHQRSYESDLFQPAVENTYANTGLSLDASGSMTSPAGQQFVGADGQTIIGVGAKSFYSAFIGLHAKPYSGSGTFIYPTAVVNSANFAPVTNAIAPGEYVTIYGAGLAPGIFPQAGETLPSPLPVTLGGVQVTVNGRNAPLYVVTPTQISFIVPYATGGTASAPEPYASIQVNNNGTRSNSVSVRVGYGAPGIWTSGADGISIARAQKLPDYSILSETNTVKPGDTIVIYCTGLGAVTPSVPDGAAAPSSPLSRVAGEAWVYMDGIPVRPSFAGLAPGFAGLYQINAVVPRSVTRGASVPLDIEVRNQRGVTTAYTAEAKIPIAPSVGEIAATFSPNPVSAGTDGKWRYTITLRETGGLGITLQSVFVNTSDISSRIADFFGSTRLAANGRLAASVISGYTHPADEIWKITGVDDLGNQVSLTAAVKLQ